jgi:hypothetical protein
MTKGLAMRKESRNNYAFGKERLMIDISYTHQPDKRKPVNNGYLLWIYLEE